MMTTANDAARVNAAVATVAGHWFRGAVFRPADFEAFNRELLRATTPGALKGACERWAAVTTRDLATQKLNAPERPRSSPAQVTMFRETP